MLGESSGAGGWPRSGRWKLVDMGSKERIPLRYVSGKYREADLGHPQNKIENRNLKMEIRGIEAATLAVGDG